MHILKYNNQDKAINIIKKIITNKNISIITMKINMCNHVLSSFFTQNWVNSV